MALLKTALFLVAFTAFACVFPIAMLACVVMYATNEKNYVPVFDKIWGKIFTLILK